MDGEGQAIVHNRLRGDYDAEVREQRNHQSDEEDHACPKQLLTLGHLEVHGCGASPNALLPDRGGPNVNHPAACSARDSRPFRAPTSSAPSRRRGAEYRSKGLSS